MSVGWTETGVAVEVAQIGSRRIVTRGTRSERPTATESAVVATEKENSPLGADRVGIPNSDRNEAMLSEGPRTDCGTNSHSCTDFVTAVVVDVDDEGNPIT